METDALLAVRHLRVEFQTRGGRVQAVRGVDFSVSPGETLAIVGESGCGKSVTSLSVMGLLPKSATVVEGSITFAGRKLTELSPKQMRQIRGNDLSMIFQDPMTALNPTLTIGMQMTEGLIHQKKVSRSEAGRRAIAMLKQVGIPNPEERMKAYPHQFSGGMRQRIVIAMALICQPKLIIADEPTTALDVTIQAQILDLFDRLRKLTGVSIILITHDLGVVAKIADRIAVMYAGKIVEIGDKRTIFYHPRHPYTQALLNSIVRLDLITDVLKPIQGQPPDLFSPPPGCAFSPRCPYAMEVCDHVQAPTILLDAEHRADCWLLDKRAETVRKQIETMRGK